MEGVETVDVSWLHHTQKDNLSRCKSASSVVSDRSNIDCETSVASKSNPERTASVDRRLAQPPQAQPAPTTETKPNSQTEDDAKPDDKPADGKSAGTTPPLQKSAPKPIAGRRNSWISSLSSKFSSGSTPPSQSSFKAQPSPKTNSPASKLDMHNPFGAAYSPREKEDEKKDDHNSVASTSPKGPSFLHNAFRKLSVGAGGSGRSTQNGTICERRVMNLDQDRDRCKIPDLNQAKLRRVAFSVDVEIAGISRRESDEETPSANSKRRIVPNSNGQKVKRSNSKSKERDEASTLKHPQAAAVDKDKQSSDNNTSPSKTASVSENSQNDAKPAGESKEPTRKQEKKKRSEEERRERRERKRRQAEANGSIPMQLTADDEDDTRPPVPGVSRAKTQSHPTTDPVRIYRRCCQLRETPVLKRIVDEISSPSSTLAESPGTVGVLDLTNFPMTSQDTATFSDWLAVVPVRKLILDKCALTDDSVRAILAALLSTKSAEHMRNRRRRTRKSDPQTLGRQERFSVVERLSLKDNPKIGKEGWRHICLFIHLSKSLKAIDLSGIPFPKSPATLNDASPTDKPLDLAATFANSLAERFGGDHLEELLMSECKPTTEGVKKICDAATTVGLRRLGFANNELTREGLEHIVRCFKSGKCEGLDLGGNAICDHLDLITSAIEQGQPLYALSLADCALTPSAIYPLFQGLTRLSDLRFIDFSHNPELFSRQPDALATFRRFLPKMPSLKRIHLADVNISADHAIALAEVLPECPSLCHLNILENPSITSLAAATDPASQEEACAVYASLMAAVRVSRSIIAVDIEVPSAENNEVVKALASQIVAYCLQNLERGAIEAELSEPADTSATRDTVPVPEILQHIVGINGGDEPCEEDDEPAPDEDYVIGGTGVVKALGVCLGNLDHHLPGDQSGPPSGTTTPRHRRSRPYMTKRPRDMSKNLLDSARNIRTRIQSALVREDKAGNDANYRRLQFLDFTLHRMIQRFEDEYPETRIVPQPVISVNAETSSQNSGEGGNGLLVPGIRPFANSADETAVDDEDTDQYAVRLSRSSSITSFHSRALTSEEGHAHRLGQNIRRGFLSPNWDPADEDSCLSNDSHVSALREKLDRLHEDQARSHFESVGADKAFGELGSTVDELWAIQRQDTEAFEKFKQSQIAAQINSGKRPASPMPGHGSQSHQATPEGSSS
ncbi:putative cell wall biogenesis protein Mhp1 [Aspergillus affinis]|uniref:putative cell wall biogenesis protein Mhp1 n=1 Tax=Aspergillus affinis TaxID=1070780 RepID=UPI0022FEB919|nr:putative cell wall biogenesis protein Mhp1 [Aspergillus affinis]KAI9038799.1 putative cell wall biogenesis protein Mhp1 [Aspergillus affinis]